VAQVIKGDATIPGHGWELLKPLPPVIGIAERVGHTAALATHQSAFIGVWLAIKTLGVAPWQHEKPEGRYAYQRNLVVTLVSLGWGAIGAQAIWWLRADPAQWLDTVVLIGVAVLACGAARPFDAERRSSSSSMRLARGRACAWVHRYRTRLPRRLAR
jgi:hypothetical protein